MGDIPKPQYVMRRQVIEEELQRAKPPTDPDLDRAQAILEDFARFWDAEPKPAERRKLLLSPVRAGLGQGQPDRGRQTQHAAFANYFTAASEVRNQHPKADADDEATKAGATGLEPATSAVTGQRSNLLSYAPAFASERRGPRVPQYAKAARPRVASARASARRRAKLAGRPVVALGLGAWRSSARRRC